MNTRRRPALSILEVLVTISVLGVLVGLSAVAIQNARDSALRVSCTNNLMQIGTALHHYHELNQRLPPCSANPDIIGDPNRCLSWMALILPEIGEDALYKKSVDACSIQPDVYQNPPHSGFATVVAEYVCPVDGRLLTPLIDDTGLEAAYTSYVGIYAAVRPYETQGFYGALGRVPGFRFSEITDGLSQTVLVGERPPPYSLQGGWWYPQFAGTSGYRGPSNLISVGGAPMWVDPNCSGLCVFGPGRLDNPCDRYHLWSLHFGGANFLFCDGAVHFLSYGAAPILPALASINGGEVLDLPFD